MAPDTLPVPRWRYGEPYLALLDTLEAALPLAHPSDLSQEAIARRVFAMARGLDRRNGAHSRGGRRAGGS